MAKVMLNRNTLDEFTRFLEDITFAIKLELNKSSSQYSTKDIYILLGELSDAWRDVYDPIEKDMSLSLRSLYSRYLSEKKAGNLEQAESYLKCYLNLKKI